MFGAGGIGGVVGARLAQHGHDVVLIARGAHRDAIRERGLTIEDPAGTEVLDLPVTGSPAEAGITGDDVVLLAMKSQDTGAAVRDLAESAPTSTPVFCFQNGVENERVALRSFERVYGCAVLCPTASLRPGVVQAFSAPTTGIFDVGRFPTGSDDVAAAVAAAIDSSAMKSVARDDIMRWKYRKLVTNLGNAIEAVCGPSSRGGELTELVAAEAESVLDAAGIDRATVAEDLERRARSPRAPPRRWRATPGRVVVAEPAARRRRDRDRLPQRRDRAARATPRGGDTGERDAATTRQRARRDAAAAGFATRKQRCSA